jgi:hypothetical protein
MARINRRPSANRRSTLVDPEKTASGSMAEKFRSSILGAPDEFRKSSFDPDTASLDELRGRSGEITTAMAPAPTELTFSDTGKVRDIWSQPPHDFELSDPGSPGWSDPGSSGFGDPRSSAGAGSGDAFSVGSANRALTSARESYMSKHGTTVGFDPRAALAASRAAGSSGSFGGGSSGGLGSASSYGPVTGKAITTGRIVREHPDKFKDEGDPMEAGGRFFKRIPAIKRRTDPSTAFSRMPDGSGYGTPGGYKFIDESDYLGKPDSSLIGF